MSKHLIVIEKEAWEELTGLVRDLANEVRKLIKDRRLPDVMTHKEAAAYLGYTSAGLHNLKNDRMIQFSQCGRKVTYRLEDLDHFREEHKVPKRR